MNYAESDLPWSQGAVGTICACITLSYVTQPDLTLAGSPRTLPLSGSRDGRLPHKRESVTGSQGNSRARVHPTKCFPDSTSAMKPFFFGVSSSVRGLRSCRSPDTNRAHGVLPGGRVLLRKLPVFLPEAWTWPPSEAIT